MNMMISCASVPCWSRVLNQGAPDDFGCTKLLEDCHCPMELDSDKFHPADWCSIMTANSAFAVRSLLFPEVQPSRLPVVAYSGVFTMPKADFQASLGPHIGETCSAHLCMHKHG